MKYKKVLAISHDSMPLDDSKAVFNMAYHNKRHIFTFINIWIVLLLCPVIFSYLQFGFSSSITSYYNFAISLIMLLAILYNFEVYIVSVDFLMVITLLVGQLISISLNQSFSSIALIIMEIISIAMMFLILPEIKTDSDLATNFCLLITLLGFILCIFNMIANNSIIFSFWESGNAYITATSSIFRNKNTWGQFLFPVAMSNIYLVSTKKKKVYWLCLLLTAYNIFASFSKSVMLTTAVFVAIYILLTSQENIKRNFAIIILTIFGLFLISKNQTLVAYINTYIFRDADEVYSGRNILWLIGWDYFREHSAFGVGMGRSPIILGEHGIILSEFHNAYLEILIAGGIIKICIIAAIYLKAVRASLAICKHDINLGAFLFSSQIALLIYSFFESFKLFGVSFNTVIITFIVVSLPLMIANSPKKIAEVKK
ncbi:MAG: O-antigen ligase family protein [Clostridia bacterium]